MGSAGKACRSIKPRRTYLIVTDLLMPGQHGFEFISELSNDFPKVLAIAISGHPAGMNLLKAAQKLGVTRILERLFQPGQPLTAVEGALTSSATPA